MSDTRPRSGVMFSLLRRLAWLLPMAASAFFGAAKAEQAPFDLTGPTLSGTVTRGGSTLPIAKVPSLAAGDKVVIHAELPPSQSAHYLMVAAFLRGSTNPPPNEWFFRCETWSKACQDNGLALTVPKDAEQLLVFFAPKTGGDFRTLKSAVQGKPGAFVRAAQGMRQAALDRSRLDKYLATLSELNASDPAAVHEAAPLLARSLSIKVDDKCLDRLPNLQAACLMQNQEALILNDGRGASVVSTLTSGPTDLVFQAATPIVNSGQYLPFIGSMFDIARLMDTFRTAHYQYIPALTALRDERMVLMLNTPPSFHDPQSVLVTALPAIEPAAPPPLRAVDAHQSYCSGKASLTLPVEGAPLTFSTGYAHDLKLTVTTPAGETVTLPVQADARRGGLLVDNSRASAAGIDDSGQAVLSGYWGFEPFTGAAFSLQNPLSQRWVVAGTDANGLVAGREAVVRLVGDASCIQDMHLRDAASRESSVAWKAVSENTVEVRLPLQDASPGAMSLVVAQFGAKPQSIPLYAYASASRLDGFVIHAGDAAGTLKGGRLDQIANLQLKGVMFAPGDLTSSGTNDELTMKAADAQLVAAFHEGDSTPATVWLKDGRTQTFNVKIEPPRPRGELVSKSRLWSAGGNDRRITLANADELPLNATLTFSVRTLWPATYTRDEQIEVATADGLYSTQLTVANGGMTLADGRIAVASLKPASAFGPSAYGPLKFRLTSHGVNGEWQPLATLVRLPSLEDLHCPVAGDEQCQLMGSNLFLLDAVATDPQFSAPVRVPAGFSGSSLAVPNTTSGRIYFRLRDAREAINTASFDPPAGAPQPDVAAPAPAPPAAG